MILELKVKDNLSLETFVTFEELEERLHKADVEGDYDEVLNRVYSYCISGNYQRLECGVVRADVVAYVLLPEFIETN